MSTLTFWNDSVAMPHFPKLDRDLSVDVVVVGGGIAGVTTAYLLAKQNRKVVLLERNQLGQGETGRTSAHVSDALDDGYKELIRLHGKSAARLMAESHRAAIEDIAAYASAEGIDCDLERVPGYLFLREGDDVSILHDECVVTKSLGMHTKIIQGVPGLAAAQGPCLQYDGQLQFHPLKYLKGLIEAFQKLGGQVFADSAVESFHEDGVETRDHFRVKARFTVVATNSPVNGPVAIHTKQAAYRSYMIGLEVPHGTTLPALYWDTPDETGAYHYARMQKLNDDFDLLLVGGEDHRTGQSDSDTDKTVLQRYEALEAWAREYFPKAQSLLYRWSGQVLEPVDGAAFIGQHPGMGENVYVITGDSGHGLTHATLGAKLITDLILGRANFWQDVYDPSRIRLKASVEFFKENLNTAKQYADLVSPGDIHSIFNLRPGEGAILREGLSQYAVYKDDEGRAHAFSAVCPHLGGIVHWNEGEKSFDCPCHGSRFDCYGKVIDGPANSDLKPCELTIPSRPAPDYRPHVPTNDQGN